MPLIPAPGPGRVMATATLVYANVDMRQWHTYGVEWSPGRLASTLDGRVFGVMTAAVPTVPMTLALQTHATQAIGAVSSATPRDVTLAVDWVSVYRYR